MCISDQLPEVELISLVGETLPRYKLRADTITDFTDYHHQDWGIQQPSPASAHDLQLSNDQIREVFKYFRKYTYYLRYHSTYISQLLHYVWVYSLLLVAAGFVYVVALACLVLFVQLPSRVCHWVRCMIGLYRNIAFHFQGLKATNCVGSIYCLTSFNFDISFYFFSFHIANLLV